jgi:hypothetical protein
MNEIQTAKGVLKYRNPTVLENMEMLKASREFFKNEDPLGAKIEIIKHLKPLLDYSSLDGITCFEELNQYGDEMTMPLSDIADQILSKVAGAFSKKN